MTKSTLDRLKENPLYKTMDKVTPFNAHELRFIDFTLQTLTNFANKHLKGGELKDLQIRQIAAIYDILSVTPPKPVKNVPHRHVLVNLQYGQIIRSQQMGQKTEADRYKKYFNLNSTLNFILDGEKRINSKDVLVELMKYLDFEDAL